MAFSINPFNTLRSFEDKKHFYYSLQALEEQKIGSISRLPISLRIMLESLLRHCDGKKVREEDIQRLSKWNPKSPDPGDVPFVVARVILQDFTGVPLLVDLAAMRDAMNDQKKDPKLIEPLVPVDLVVDHSVQVDQARVSDAFLFNLQVEFERNSERYEFLKWGQEAFHTFKVVPPGIGIVHQVNLEHLASVVTEKNINGVSVLFPDTLVGTDSHTTMVNGLGVVAWGVGGIEAEAAMLGQPVSIQTPEVIGVLIEGKLQEGVTATDLTLRITELLRKENVVGKFVEFFGEGAATLTVPDRATIGNMAPEYGATMGFFPSDEKTLEYLRMTGRREEEVKRVETYLKTQKLFGIPRRGEVDYTKVLELNLSSIKPSIAGPKRPQDRLMLGESKKKFLELLTAPVASGGYGKSQEDLHKEVVVHVNKENSDEIAKDEGGINVANGKGIGWSEDEMVSNRPATKPIAPAGYSEGVSKDIRLKHGSVVIAAITSCTNTSNPSVMVGAGILAKKAVEKGLKINRGVKTSLAPGSRVVTDYLEQAGLQPYLDKLGFQLVAYGCTTCIGNSGPLDATIENAIKEHDLISASVLSGNRNFEARIHSSVKANFLMSPPLVIAYALAGRVDIDLEKEALGQDKEGNPVYLKDIWPTTHEIHEVISKSIRPDMFKKRYANVLTDNPLWDKVQIRKSVQYKWEENSTYIRKPPFFADFSLKLPEVQTYEHMRALVLFGDSVTTDHISPAGAFRSSSPAGKYLLEQGVKEDDFNSYGSRRGNHEVMMRGTFANVRIRNRMAGEKEGGFTLLQPEGTLMSIYEACQIYAERNTPLILFAGKDYGMGSSRDWAAKGPALLGVKVVVAQSFERIHRSNLIGMGVLPLRFKEGMSWEKLGIRGNEIFSVKGVGKKVVPHQEVVLEIERHGGKEEFPLISCIDTPTEADYYTHGGILPFVLRQIITSQK